MDKKLIILRELFRKLRGDVKKTSIEDDIKNSQVYSSEETTSSYDESSSSTNDSFKDAYGCDAGGAGLCC